MVVVVGGTATGGGVGCAFLQGRELAAARTSGIDDIVCKLRC